MGMDFKEVKKEVVKFTADRNWDQFHTPENLAKSISIEAAELLECFQWSPEYDKQAAKEELADIMNYCILMADKMGIDVEEAIMEKIRKNAEKYPVDKSYGNSKKYTEL
ncbi:nucleotide pyrophosphohydrolase [Butyrivibrio proteoclasticus]|uniref:nucleotide pyrophosphohydrolase n=1 Tax=Butyrivibrio proteoclasticus TaxID=43305 RepID=UPI001FA80C28|nr:nucleotide pyrophosphohydrolase [Butyrivibrio proteoclasticus]